jgi:hypothetical protein
MKSWKTQSAGSGASLSDMRNSCKTLVVKSVERRPVGRSLPLGLILLKRTGDERV